MSMEPDTVTAYMPEEAFSRIAAIVSEFSPLDVADVLILTVSSDYHPTVCGASRSPKGWVSAETVDVNAVIAEYVDGLRANGHLPPAVSA